MSELSREDRIRLLAEMAAPYRKLRNFIYLACGASAGVGGVIFFFRVLAGREWEVSLPSLALQLGVLAGSIGLLKLESGAQKRLEDRVRQRLNQS